MSFGALTFLSPWLLAALAILPLIYWLLRAIPPRPRRIEFPPTRILKDVKNLERTPAKTPWWLLLIRLLAAAAIIFALSEPVLNREKALPLTGGGPLAIIVDNGWSSAPHWDRRMEKVDRLIATAQRDSRPVIVIATASAHGLTRAGVQAPGDARITARGLLPQPFASDLGAAAAALKQTLEDGSRTQNSGVNIIWLSDGIDHGGTSGEAMEGLLQLALGGTLAVMTDNESKEPLALASTISEGGRLNAIVKRASGAARAGSVSAYSARGENLGRVVFQLSVGETQTSVPFDIPLELRNQVSRIAIDGLRSAGAVNLLDARSKWRRVALISSEGGQSAQPLLAPLYYLEKALLPYAQIVKPGDANVVNSIEEALKRKVGVMILADIGTLSIDTIDKLETWVDNGGLLVRFAGPRMEKAGDQLLPVPLRIGGRTLGGALSWSSPQQLAEFEELSPFAGLKTSAEITVSRQVLADPARLPASADIWARLVDGTPLVTASKRGDGRLVLFHVTANSDWSNLPISGLFVDMLKKIVALGNTGGAGAGSGAASDTGGSGATQGANEGSRTLLPIQTLDGFGDLRAPPPNAQPIPVGAFSKAISSADHPPGYYGSMGAPRALNIASRSTVLKPLGVVPVGALQLGYGAQSDTPLKPLLFAGALALVLVDMLAVLFLQGIGTLFYRRRAKVAGVGFWFLLCGALSAQLALAPVGPAFGQTVFDQREARDQREGRKAGEVRALDRHARQATNKVTLGYVLTGDSATDTMSRLGLSGLGLVMARRTSITAGAPIGVDIVNDEIAFYPVLYWPILHDTQALPERVLAKIDAYMKQGGLIIFDTKDYGRGGSGGLSRRTASKTPLQRLLGRLDIPRLEPVPPGHVLTKSFYLLDDFPGRWSGGQLWVEAGAVDAARQSGEQQATATDGVTSIMITPNDFAAAWAIDERGHAIYPTVATARRQREMAFRAGINIVMHALTGNYKADQVHVPALLQRLGQ